MLFLRIFHSRNRDQKIGILSASRISFHGGTVVMASGESPVLSTEKAIHRQPAEISAPDNCLHLKPDYMKRLRGLFMNSFFPAVHPSRGMPMLTTSPAPFPLLRNSNANYHNPRRVNNRMADDAYFTSRWNPSCATSFFASGILSVAATAAIRAKVRSSAAEKTATCSALWARVG